MKGQNKKINSKFLSALVAASLLLLQFSCKEKIDGCMDVTAVNWDASADESCEDCCTYPSLTVSYEHVFGDTLISFDSLYFDESDNYFKITSIRYYLSDFILISNDVDEYRPTDSLEVQLYTNGDNEEKTIADNFALVSKFTNSSNIGSFRNTDLTIDSLVFSIGLNATANSVDPTSVSVGEPLAIDSDSMFQSRTDGYIFAKIGIVTDTMTMDTTIYRITGNDKLMEMRFEWEDELVRGTNVVIPIKLDYEEWFKGINFANDSYETIEANFVMKLTNAFFIDD